MCGICGILYPGHGLLGAKLRRMNDAQRHRGPDGEGYAIDAGTRLAQYGAPPPADTAGACGLAHRRLAIIDPENGRQPMVSNQSRCVVVLNGEIYNFQALRNTLKADYNFVTDSDTEVLLALYETMPDRPQDWISRLNGIFAFVIWDRMERRLLMARDHFGVKPLCYTRLNNAFLFASEAKALLAAGVPARLDKSSLHVFLNVRYVPGNQTLFKGIQRFPAAHYAWVHADGVMQTPVGYYRLPDPQPSAGMSRAEHCAALYDTHAKAVGDQLLSDVPLGVSLSGGLDSSMNVAAARAALDGHPGLRAGDGKLHTFTIGFNEPTDELDDARLVADRFHAEHTSACLEANPLRRMAEVIRAVEEPKINILQGYMLAELARSRVKVLLGGLGGDELFAGYDIHAYCHTLGRAHRLTPHWLQRGLFSPVGTLWWHAQYRSGLMRYEHYRIGGQIALSVGDRAQFYARLRNAWDYDRPMYRRIYAHPGDFIQRRTTASYFEPYFGHCDDYLEDVLRVEINTKMKDDFLLNEDRVMSAHGVEGRVPFLDRRLVDLAMSIPAREKMTNGGLKAMWKESVRQVLPAGILAKKKQGFTFSSYHQWQKDLRATVERELTLDWCEDTGLFNPRFIREVLNYPPHPNLRWHYFMVWMMLGVKTWLEVFNADIE